VEIQGARIDQILDSGQKTDELDESEYDLQRQFNALIMKIDKMMKED